MKKRVVITGHGLICPIGNSVEESFSNALKGKNGIDFIKSFDTEQWKVKIGGEIKDLDYEKFIVKNQLQLPQRLL